MKLAMVQRRKMQFHVERRRTNAAAIRVAAAKTKSTGQDTAVIGERTGIRPVWPKFAQRVLHQVVGEHPIEGLIEGSMEGGVPELIGRQQFHLHPVVQPNRGPQHRGGFFCCFLPAHQGCAVDDSSVFRKEHGACQ